MKGGAASRTWKGIINIHFKMTTTGGDDDRLIQTVSWSRAAANSPECFRFPRRLVGAAPGRKSAGRTSCLAAGDRARNKNPPHGLIRHRPRNRLAANSSSSSRRAAALIAAPAAAGGIRLCSARALRTPAAALLPRSLPSPDTPADKAFPPSRQRLLDVPEAVEVEVGVRAVALHRDYLQVAAKVPGVEP